MGVTGSMRRQSIDSEMVSNPRVATRKLGVPPQGNKYSACSTGDSVGVGISQYGAIDPQRHATQHRELKENSMHESASTITITEFRLFANATVELLSARPNSGCGHPRLRSFKFSNGQTIRMCPDCSKSDEHRRAVLASTKRKVRGTEFCADFF